MDATKYTMQIRDYFDSVESDEDLSRLHSVIDELFYMIQATATLQSYAKDLEKLKKIQDEAEKKAAEMETCSQAYTTITMNIYFLMKAFEKSKLIDFLRCEIDKFGKMGSTGQN